MKKFIVLLALFLIPSIYALNPVLTPVKDVDQKEKILKIISGIISDDNGPASKKEMTPEDWIKIQKVIKIKDTQITLVYLHKHVDSGPEMKMLMFYHKDKSSITMISQTPVGNGAPSTGEVLDLETGLTSKTFAEAKDVAIGLVHKAEYAKLFESWIDTFYSNVLAIEAQKAKDHEAGMKEFRDLMNELELRKQLRDSKK